MYLIFGTLNKVWRSLMSIKSLALTAAAISAMKIVKHLAPFKSTMTMFLRFHILSRRENIFRISVFLVKSTQGS